MLFDASLAQVLHLAGCRLPLAIDDDDEGGDGAKQPDRQVDLDPGPGPSVLNLPMHDKLGHLVDGLVLAKLGQAPLVVPVGDGKLVELVMGVGILWLGLDRVGDFASHWTSLGPPASRRKDPQSTTSGHHGRGS